MGEERIAPVILAIVAAILLGATAQMFLQEQTTMNLSLLSITFVANSLHLYLHMYVFEQINTNSEVREQKRLQKNAAGYVKKMNKDIKQIKKNLLKRAGIHFVPDYKLLVIDNLERRNVSTRTLAILILGWVSLAYNIRGELFERDTLDFYRDIIRDQYNFSLKTRKMLDVMIVDLYENGIDNFCEDIRDKKYNFTYEDEVIFSTIYDYNKIYKKYYEKRRKSNDIK